MMPALMSLRKDPRIITPLRMREADSSTGARGLGIFYVPLLPNDRSTRLKWS